MTMEILIMAMAAQVIAKLNPITHARPSTSSVHVTNVETTPETCLLAKSVMTKTEMMALAVPLIANQCSLDTSAQQEGMLMTPALKVSVETESKTLVKIAMTETTI